MIIKALSVWQPWASLIADGHKRFETRSWSTKYRGPLLICAALRIPKPAEYEHLMMWVDGKPLPLGVALCVVDLIEVYNCEEEDTDYLSLTELAMGDFRPGRFAWRLENVRKLANPYEVRGKQRLFNVDLPEGAMRGL